MNYIDPAVARIWKDTKRAFGDSLKPPQALVFLGVILACPFHEWLLKDRVTFVPGAWLHGRPGTGKTPVSKSAAAFYGAIVRVHPWHTIHAVTQALDSATGSLPLMDEYQPGKDRSMDTTLAIADNPPLVVSESAASERRLAERYLHFTPSPTADAALASIEQRLPFILAAIQDNHSFVRLLLDSIISDSASYVSHPGLDGRKSSLLTTAWAVFAAIDSLFTGEVQASEDLKGWLCRHGESLFPQSLAA